MEQHVAENQKLDVHDKHCMMLGVSIGTDFQKGVTPAGFGVFLAWEQLARLTSAGFLGLASVGLSRLAAAFLAGPGSFRCDPTGPDPALVWHGLAWPWLS